MAEVFDVSIRDETIRLGQLLKLASLVEDGTDAKAVIAGGDVTVDGFVETRRGAQIRPGSIVKYDGQQVRVTRD